MGRARMIPSSLGCSSTSRTARLEKRPFPAFLLTHRGELERVNYVGDPGDNKLWEPVFESNNDAFFAVGYGATRRVEAPENLDMAARTCMTFLRGQRLQGLFQESFTLIPLETWLPAMRDRKPGRYQEVETLLSTLLKPGHCRFTGDQERQVDYLFEFAGGEDPFPLDVRRLSRVHRLGGDMLFHACQACPPKEKLTIFMGWSWWMTSIFSSTRAGR